MQVLEKVRRMELGVEMEQFKHLEFMLVQQGLKMGQQFRQQEPTREYLKQQEQ